MIIVVGERGAVRLRGIRKEEKPRTPCACARFR